MYTTIINKQKGHKMIKKFLSLFAILLLLASPVAMADEIQTEDTQTEVNPNGWVEDVLDETDDYNVDGCFC